MKILVTGLGVISSIGNNVDENLTSLTNETSGLSRIEILKELRKEFIGGEIKMDDESLKDFCGVSNKIAIQRSTLLGLAAAKEAWGDRKHDLKKRTALFYGTTIGGINISAEIINSNDLADLQNNYNNIHDSTFGTDFIAQELGIYAYKATISTACSTAANSILMGARMIRAGLIDRALVGGSEAITQYTLNGFDSLNLYDTAPNRPFDENRTGLNLGEGGAFLVLESEQCATESQSEVFGELIGWGNACDAYHQTGSSPEGTGATKAFWKAMDTADIEPHEIDYVNCHGTGTINNDITESTVLKNVFDTIPPFSSTKSFTGHTLAAAGGIEAVYSLLSLKHGLLFPNLNFKEPITETGFIPVLHTQKDVQPKIILSSSFGFGGNCTQLLFKR